MADSNDSKFTSKYSGEQIEALLDKINNLDTSKIGASTYNYAVSNGYSGTEEEWARAINTIIKNSDNDTVTYSEKNELKTIVDES